MSDSDSNTNAIDTCIHKVCRDLVPWSIIYGAQNDMHEREVMQLHEELRKLALTVLTNVFTTTDFYWSTTYSSTYTQWPLIAKYITEEDVKRFETEYSDKRPYEVDNLQRYYERDIHIRADYIRALISSSNNNMQMKSYPL
jgi:hypothetical protein